MRTALALLSLVAVAAGPAIPPPVPNPFNRQLKALDPLSRMAALRRAVTTSGGACTRVTLAHDDGPYGNLAKWSIRCGTDGDYALFLGPSGEVQLRGCEEVRTLKLPACILPPAPPRPAGVRRR